MAIPSVELLSNRPGGAVPAAMNALTDLENNKYKASYNRVKSALAPTSLTAEAASKLAYANLVGPQFISKLLQNPSALGNLSEEQKRAMLDLVQKAGMGQSTGNALTQNMPSNIPQSTGSGQPHTNAFSRRVKDAYNALIGNQPGQNNALNQSMPNTQQNEMPSAVSNAQPVTRPANGVSKVGEQWYDGEGNPVYGEETTQPNQPSYAENAGNFLGTQKQKEIEGQNRAKALEDVGETQLGLMRQGDALNNLTDLVTKPEFQNMRNTIPAFQSTQLNILKTLGTPQEREMIGKLQAAAESVVANTVAGMGKKHLVTEYELAKRQKVNDSDTMESINGKMKNAIELHDIAEKKNDIIANLLSKGTNLVDAVKQANKKVSLKDVQQRTNKLFERKIEITNSKTGEKKEVTIEEARKMGVPNV